MRIDDCKRGPIASALRSLAGAMLLSMAAMPGCDDGSKAAETANSADEAASETGAGEASVCDEALRHLRDCLGDEDERVRNFEALECTEWTEAAEAFVQLDCEELSEQLAVDPNAPPQVKEDGCSRTHWSCGGWPDWGCWCVAVPCASCNCVNWC